MTPAPTLALLGPDESPDAWTVVEPRRPGPRPEAPASLYLKSTGGPFLRVADSLLDSIGDPNHVVIHVNPRRHQLRLVPDLYGLAGRRVRRPPGDRRHGRRPTISAGGIPEALGLYNAKDVVRFDAVATEDAITLTMRGEP